MASVVKGKGRAGRKGRDLMQDGELVLKSNGVLGFNGAKKWSKRLGERAIELAGIGCTLSQICKDIGVDASILCMWKREGSPYYKKEFAEAYALAYREGADVLEAESLAIADDTTGDTYEDVNKAGVVTNRPNSANVQRDKLRIETRQFMATVRNRAKFGKSEVMKHEGTVETSFIINKFGSGKEVLKEAVVEKPKKILQEGFDG